MASIVDGLLRSTIAPITGAVLDLVVIVTRFISHSGEKKVTGATSLEVDDTELLSLVGIDELVELDRVVVSVIEEPEPILLEARSCCPFEAVESNRCIKSFTELMETAIEPTIIGITTRTIINRDFVTKAKFMNLLFLNHKSILNLSRNHSAFFGKALHFEDKFGKAHPIIYNTRILLVLKKCENAMLEKLMLIAPRGLGAKNMQRLKGVNAVHQGNF